MKRKHKRKAEKRKVHLKRKTRLKNAAVSPKTVTAIAKPQPTDIREKLSGLKDGIIQTKVYQTINGVTFFHTRLFKRSLTVVLIISFLVSTYLLLFPIVPAVQYKLDPPDPGKVVYKLDPATAAKLEVSDSSAQDAVAVIPKDNRLVIPKIGVDSEIIEGKDLTVLNYQEGVWHEPPARSPEGNGNMVIAGHRLQYLPPNMTTFYNLDKLAVGDRVLVYWKQKSYVYEIFATRTLSPDHVEVTYDNPKIPHELTLYTCTPLASRADRLVVQAKLI